MDQEHPLPPARRALVTVAIMAATLMVVLDTTIANVALPHMQAALGATSESVVWVLTSYIVGTAVALPLTGWLADRIGRRELFTIAVVGFTATSVLCGISTSLTLMVASRLAQGLFGAFMMPLSQAVMYDITPREKHAQAMTIWGMVVMVGPIMGPVLGGYLTGSFDWRWVFFVNVPIGLLTAPAMWLLLPPAKSKRRAFDFLGFLALGAALISMQLLLDRGNHLDWFDSTEIIVECGIALAALWIFVIRTASTRDPLMPVDLFRDRNFVMALIFTAVAGGIATAGAALVAPMLQQLMGYPVLEAGILVAPRGIGTMIGMFAAGRLMRLVDGRFLLLAGMTCTAWSLHMMTGFELSMGKELVITSGLVQGLGLGFTMLPLNLLAFATLAPSLRTDAASLYTLLRSIGGSIAIAVATAMLARNLQTSHADLGASLTVTGRSLIDMSVLQELGSKAEIALYLFDAEVNRQALMIAYLDDYWLMMWAVVLTTPLILLMRGARPTGEALPIGE